ncbi:hypothetical protein [Streptomyces phaeofaciens]|uniref:hypothetical protein n=1 Tax=Streptomyces phaeofaciens TaxID=68254 RepID=UPI0036C117D9
MPDSAAPAGPEDASGPGEVERLRARVAVLETELRTARGAPTAPAVAPSRPARHPLRSLLAVVLVVLGCLLAPLGVVAAWSAELVGDTDRYVDTVRPLASDPDIQNAAAASVTDAVMSRLDLPALLQSVAPAQRPLLEKALGALGEPLQDAVRSFVHDKARAVVASAAFQRIWADANRRVHDTLDKALTGSGGGAVRLEKDTVTLDLAPVVEEVKERLADDGLTVARRIPTVHTDFTLVRSDDIGRIRSYVRLLELAGLWLPVLAVLLVAAGVLLAAHRRRALVVSALCFALATLSLGVALSVFRVVYLDALPAGVSQPAAASVYDTLTRFLRTGVRVVVALGVVVAVAAWLTGPGRRAVFVRGLWHAGIGAVRTTADHAGLRTGPVGPFVRRFRTWITWILVAATVLVYLLWPYPTGWVVIGLALTLLFALSVVDFLSAEAPAAGSGSEAPA